MNFWKSTIGTSMVVAVVALTLPVSCAKQADHDHMQHDHSDHADMSHHHHDDATSDQSTKPVAQSYADAVKQIQSHMTSLDAIMKSGKYDDVHKDSEAIRQLCASLAQLAAAENSPVPKEKVKDVTEMANELSAASRSFHSAAHDEDLPQVKEHYAHMTRLVESLAQYARTQ